MLKNNNYENLTRSFNYLFNFTFNNDYIGTIRLRRKWVYMQFTSLFQKDEVILMSLNKN